MKDVRESILWYSALRRVKKDRPKIIAITGSIAKTSTKEAIGRLLNLAYPQQVRVSYGNLNSWPLGVPLAVLGFEINFHQQKIGFWQWLWILKMAIWRGWFVKLPKYLVLEYGTDKPGDIKALCQKLPPDFGIITIIGPAHLEAFKTVDAIAEDKGYIAELTKPGGVVFINSSDHYLTQYHKRAKARIVNVVTELEEIAVKFMEAVGRELKIDDKIIVEARTTFLPPEQRFNFKHLKNINLLDDTYNASPLAMQAALRLLKKMPGKKLAVLGSMLELGTDSPKYHKETGALARTYADKIIGVGEEAKDYQADVWYKNSDEAASHVLEDIGENVSILVKGSRGVHMEKIVDVIKEHYS